MDKKGNTYDHTIDSANSNLDCPFVHLNDYAEFMKKSQSVIRSLTPQKHFAILYADITDFKTIDTFYGFAEGERMLEAFSNFLRTSENILVCNRVFSDHFVCLLFLRQNSMSKEKTTSYRKKFNWFLSKQQIYHPDCYLHIACGLCELKTDDLIHAIDHADTARKRSKLHSDTTVVWFDKQMNQQIYLEEQTAHLAQAALRKKRYCFFLQPKVNLHTGQIIGAEALARSITEDGQMMLPDQFIPFLERNGSIIEMDYLMCRKVCEYLADRIRQGLPVVAISVNLSRLHASYENTAEVLHAMVSSYHIPPYLLEFELTETLLLKGLKSMKHLIDALRGYGYKVSIDDFGSGYTGTNIWQELNFDILKLDKKFLSTDPKVKQRNDALIPNLIKIANQLQTTVLCEGVETAVQCKYLEKMGCHLVQGYYFSEPVPCKTFDKLLVQNHGMVPNWR